MRLLVAILLLFPALAWGQSAPNWPSGYQPTAAEWNAQWAKKCDYPSCSATVNLASPGPIGSVTPNTGGFTVLAANSMVIGSPAGGNMGAGSLNLVSLFVNGVAVGPIETYTPTNKGGTITLGGTSQVLMAANPNRVGCSFQPQTGDLWFNTVGTSAAAVQPSRYLPAPSEWNCPPGFRGAITIFGATTGVSFAAEEDTVP